MGALRLVILESPFASDAAKVRAANLAYTRRALRNCLLRGEAPMASHLLYAQDGVLDDTAPAERELGIEAGLAWGAAAEATVVYCDLGVSSGMAQGIERALHEGRRVEKRWLEEGDGG